MFTNSFYIEDNKVEKIQYTSFGKNSDKGLVWINKKQYFQGVPFQVWNFSVGGYQICKEWLNKRIGYSLSKQDIQHYQNIIVILKEIIETMFEIDRAIKYSQLKHQKIFEKLQFIFAEKLEIEYTEIRLQSNFYKNLGIDSLEILELFDIIDKVFKVKINKEIVKKISTVQELVKCIAQEISMVYPQEFNATVDVKYKHQHTNTG